MYIGSDYGVGCLTFVANITKLMKLNPITNIDLFTKFIVNRNNYATITGDIFNQ